MLKDGATKPSTVESNNRLHNFCCIINFGFHDFYWLVSSTTHFGIFLVVLWGEKGDDKIKWDCVCMENSWIPEYIIHADIYSTLLVSMMCYTFVYICIQLVVHCVAPSVSIYTAGNMLIPRSIKMADDVIQSKRKGTKRQKVKFQSKMAVCMLYLSAHCNRTFTI